MYQHDPKQQLLVFLDRYMKLSCRVSLCLNSIALLLQLRENLKVSRAQQRSL